MSLLNIFMPKYTAFNIINKCLIQLTERYPDKIIANFAFFKQKRLNNNVNNVCGNKSA